MKTTPTSPVEQALAAVPRRFRLPAALTISDERLQADPASALAYALESARLELEQGRVPPAASTRRFVDALARMIHDATRVDGGDPVFQAMVLRHRESTVREFASLSAHAESDRRAVYAAVNTIAHPAKQQREPPGARRDALTRLHALAAAAWWSELQHAALQFLQLAEIGNEGGSRRALEFLAHGPEVQRLQRLAVLAPDSLVLRYQSLGNRKPPDAGSAEAVAGGIASQKRGAAVEASAVRALEELARRLNTSDPAQAEPGQAQAGAGDTPVGMEQTAVAPPGIYRVVSSMRVPASIPASHDRAKAEWDAVLLRRGDDAGSTAGEAAAWAVCLLVEAKSSIEAATNDLPQLLRGLKLLAHAGGNSFYPFMTRQGEVLLSGASLSALTDEPAALARTVLYCCDAPVEKNTRLLSASSRMQLLSAQSSLEFASAIADGKHPDPECLKSIWDELLASHRWKPVLNQYATLVQVRDLMVHPDDLVASVDDRDPGRSGST